MVRDEIKKILVVNVAGIGDFIESIPALEALRRKYEKSFIVLLVSARVYEYARRCPYVDEVYSFSVVSGRRSGVFQVPGNWGILKLIKKLRAIKFNAVINLKDIDTFKGSLRMAAFFYAIGAKYRIGRNTDDKGFFLNIKVHENVYDKKAHIDYLSQILKTLGGKIINRKPELWIEKDDYYFAEKFIAKQDFREDDLIVGINPGSDRMTRRWSNESWARLADKLIEKYSAKVIIFGAQHEARLACDINSMMNHQPVIAAGKTSLGELMALIGKCNIFVSTNSAAMHIAGAFDMPLVGLIGPGNIYRDKPFGKNVKLIAGSAGCSPCYKWKCKKMSCMKSIEARDVLKAIEVLIDEFKL
jgi:heptosyltransferase-2